MKLYFAPGACSLADHIALAESGLAYSTEKVDLRTKQTESGKDYAAINPKGYVPALELGGGEILTENIAILGYIADKAGRLIPSGGLAHWRVLETMAYISTELHKSFKPFFSPKSTDADKKAAKDILTRRFGLLDKKLARQPFVTGDQMTVADCYLFVMLMWAKEKVGLPIPANLASYYDRMKKRSAVQAALKAEGLN